MALHPVPPPFVWMRGERGRENQQPWLLVFISNRLPLLTYVRSSSSSSLSVASSRRHPLLLPLFGKTCNFTVDQVLSLSPFVARSPSLCMTIPSPSHFFFLSLPVSIPLDTPLPSLSQSPLLSFFGRPTSSLSLLILNPLDPPPSTLPSRPPLPLDLPVSPSQFPLLSFSGRSAPSLSLSRAFSSRPASSLSLLISLPLDPPLSPLPSCPPSPSPSPRLSFPLSLSLIFWSASSLSLLVSPSPSSLSPAECFFFALIFFHFILIWLI